MFGEYESESPRVPSPWDSLLPSPPSETSWLGSAKISGIPKLVPEVEEGNVEYKLKLTNISPARFDRLVTQLKWRLLEGGGQAYYELGVADSGALIGLTRNDLEQSLETLEMMAGEIGASVIVVKEIEVPPLLVALADKLSGYLDPGTGEWANKMLSRRTKVLSSDESLPTTLGSPLTEPDNEDSTAESTDFGDDTSTSFTTPAESSRGSPLTAAAASFLYKSSTSNPFRPTAQSSPFIAPFDDNLALFSMEPEPDIDVDDLRLDPLPAVAVDTSGISVDLEIASVYKPRPNRKRAPVFQGVPASGRGECEPKSNRRMQQQQSRKTMPRLILPVDKHETETRAHQRREARDKGRQDKHKAFLTCLAPVPPSITDSDNTKELVSGLRRMHVAISTSVDSVADGLEPVPTKVDCVIGDLTVHARAADGLGQSVDALLNEEVPVTIGMEPRLIVEALVVRKLSLQEAYLDFSRI